MNCFRHFTRMPFPIRGGGIFILLFLVFVAPACVKNSIINSSREDNSGRNTAANAPTPTNTPVNTPPVNKPIINVPAPILSYDEMQSKRMGGHIYTSYDVQNIFETSADRDFKLNAMLSVAPLEGARCVIKNVLPHDFLNVTIWLRTVTMSAADAPIKVLVVERVPRYFVLETKLLLHATDTVLQDSLGRPVPVKATDMARLGSITLSLSVANDALYDKLQKIKMPTAISFKNYDFPAHHWATTEARDILGYPPLLANFAYVYSSQEFRNAFMNYPYRLFGNEGPSGPDIDRESTYQKMINRPNLILGVTTPQAEGVGMMGGPGFGIKRAYLRHERVATDPYNNNYFVEVWAHEYAHIMAFSHASNMTYTKKVGEHNDVGYVRIVQEVYKEMKARGELPFMSEPVLESDLTATPRWVFWGCALSRCK